MKYRFENKAKPSIADRHTYFRYWCENWAKVGWLGVKNNPITMLGELREKSWLAKLMRANNMLNLMVRSRTGLYRKANAITISEIISSITEMVDGLYENPNRTVIHEDLVPPEILYGMGLHPWMAEFLGIVLPFIDNEVIESYIDISENAGIPADICSLPKSTMGLALAGEMPEASAIVTSNMPCDGGMTSYTVIEKKLGIPTFRLDIPFDFHSERAIKYFCGELRRLIAFLEEHTPGKMDWDRMREVCEERNRFMEAQLELWDLLRRRPAPMAAEPVYLAGMLFGIATPGQARGTRCMQRVLEITKQIIADGGSALPDERFRVGLWNPPTLIFPDLLAWAEQEYGVALLMDMLSFNRHPIIDTSTPDSMLEGLSRVIMEGPMARHTRGPSANFFSDIFYLHEHFDLDMIWMAGHIGCKNTQALLGMFREKCRERDLPLLIINYDLSDTRIVSPSGIKRQVNEFMESVMQAERLA